MGRLNTCWQFGNALVVEDELGLRPVACRKVPKGKSLCGEQQQYEVLKRSKQQPSTKTDWGGIACLRHQILTLYVALQNTLPGHVEQHPIWSVACISEAATPQIPLYSHYVRNRRCSHCLQLAIQKQEKYEWMNEWKKERMNEGKKEWMNAWLN